VRLTAVSRAAGLSLARDLPTMAGGLPLLGRGATVSERYVRALTDHGIRSVWVEDELSAGIEPAELLPEPERANGERRMRRAFEAARVAFASSRVLPAETLHELSEVVAELVERVTASAGTVVELYDVAPADRWAHRHPVNRAALGLLLAHELFRRHGWVDSTGARQFERSGERLALLGLGLLLADVGNVAVPAGVLDRPGAPSVAEWALIRGHPAAGVARLSPRSTSPRIADVIAQHHERYGGGGYPHGLRGAEIHQFGAIAAVADVYAAVTAERPYRPAHPGDVGVGIVRQGAETAFDPEVVDVFRRVVLPHPPGTEVVLADGRIGVVAAVEPASPYTPVVRLAEGASVVERRVDTRTELAPHNG
jgi:HD-GYP domain-containing protein (c-di-GMP phosphodiesterase class II)